MVKGVKDGIKEKKGQQKTKEAEFKDSTKGLVSDVNPMPVLPINDFDIKSNIATEVFVKFVRTKDDAAS